MENKVVEEIKDQVDEIETNEEIVEEKKELTPQEQLDKFKKQMSDIAEYIEFIDDIRDKQKGEEFVLKELFCRITKRTKTGHLDVEIFELEGTEEEPKAGQWKEKRRMTQGGLELSKMYANDTIFRINHKVKKLEEEMEKNILDFKLQLEEGETDEREATTGDDTN